MALQYFKVLNAETKQPIDIVYGWDREDVLKKIEHNMENYRTFNDAEIVALVPATSQDLANYRKMIQPLIDKVYANAGTAD